MAEAFPTNAGPGEILQWLMSGGLQETGLPTSGGYVAEPRPPWGESVERASERTEGNWQRRNRDDPELSRMSDPSTWRSPATGPEQTGPTYPPRPTATERIESQFGPKPPPWENPPGFNPMRSQAPEAQRVPAAIEYRPQTVMQAADPANPRTYGPPTVVGAPWSQYLPEPMVREIVSNHQATELQPAVRYSPLVPDKDQSRLSLTPNGTGASVPQFRYEETPPAASSTSPAPVSGQALSPRQVPTTEFSVPSIISPATTAAQPAQLAPPPQTISPQRMEIIIGGPNAGLERLPREVTERLKEQKNTTNQNLWTRPGEKEEPKRGGGGAPSPVRFEELKIHNPELLDPKARRAEEFERAQQNVSPFQSAPAPGEGRIVDFSTILKGLSGAEKEYSKTERETEEFRQAQEKPNDPTPGEIIAGPPIEPGGKPGKNEVAFEPEQEAGLMEWLNNLFGGQA